MSANRQNVSSLFMGAEEPAIQELMQQPGSSQGPSRSGAYEQMSRSFTGVDPQDGPSHVSNDTAVSPGTAFMGEMLSPSFGRGRRPTRARGSGDSTRAGPSNRGYSHGRGDGVPYPGDPTTNATDKALREILDLCRRNAEAVDGIFAELRALSGNVTQMRQELNVLKESSARFPSDSTKSTVRKVFKYDP